MPTAAQVIEQSSWDLNDQEPGFAYVRWPQSRLLEYLNDALRQIAVKRPDEMVDTVTLTLTPGSRQTLPATVVTLIKITQAEADSCGQGAGVSEVDLDAVLAFNAPSCAAPGTPYRCRDYAYNPNAPREFWVSPPVAQSTTGSVIASARLAPQQFLIGDINTLIGRVGEKHLSAVYAWIKHRAYKLDTESVTSEQDSRDAYNEFMQCLGLSLPTDARLLSGWNMGQQGLGDPQASRR